MAIGPRFRLINLALQLLQSSLSMMSIELQIRMRDIIYRNMIDFFGFVLIYEYKY